MAQHRSYYHSSWPFSRRRRLLCVLCTLTVCSLLLAWDALRREEWDALRREERRLASQPQEPFRHREELCRDKRGTHGKWVLDWDYAKTAQYPIMGSMPDAVIAHHEYQPTPEEPFRRATAYRWQSPSCPISRLDGVHEFCRACQRLNIDRIWVAGDSLSEGFSHSLRSQLGFPRKAYLRWLLKPFVFNCTTTDGAVFPVEHRFDRIDENFTHGLLEDKNATDRQEFLTRPSNGRVAIVVNLGVHLHSLPDFAQAFDNLWESLEQVVYNNATRKPIVWFRNSSPGHEGCLPQGEGPIKNSPVWQHPIDQTPFDSYNDWLPTDTKLYDWNLIPWFNDYAKRHTPSYAHYINIFNMTVLRRDGHVGFGDCLHYSYPGPVDWWVHLWYSSLKDMAAEAAEQQRQHIRTG